MEKKKCYIETNINHATAVVIRPENVCDVARDLHKGNTGTLIMNSRG